MSIAVVFISILSSLMAIGYFTATDPKRRRVARLSLFEQRKLLWPARIALFFPSALLVAFGDWSGLAIWAGTVTVLGWIAAAVEPATYRRWQSDTRHRWQENAQSVVALAGLCTRRIGRPFAVWSENGGVGFGRCEDNAINRPYAFAADQCPSRNCEPS